MMQQQTGLRRVTPVSNVFLSTNFKKETAESSRKLSQVGETVIGTQEIKNYHYPSVVQVDGNGS